MINWEKLVSTNRKAVVNFAKGSDSASNFTKSFSGNGSNPARQAVNTHGALYARRLARKALRRRGIAT